LDLGLDVGNGVIGLDIKSDGLARERLHEDLHGTTAEAKHQVKGRLLLNVVVGKGSSVLELFTSENQSLLLRGDSLLILDLGLDVGNGVVGLDVQGNGFSRKGLDKYLHRHLF